MSWSRYLTWNTDSVIKHLRKDAPELHRTERISCPKFHPWQWTLFCSEYRWLSKIKWNPDSISVDPETPDPVWGAGDTVLAFRKATEDVKQNRSLLRKLLTAVRRIKWERYKRSSFCKNPQEEKEKWIDLKDREAKVFRKLSQRKMLAGLSLWS